MTTLPARRPCLPVIGRALRRRGAALGAVALLLAPLPAAAFDIKAMSATEKAAFGEAVREWLLENPDVLIEMSQKLDESRMADAAENDRAVLAANQEALFNDGFSWVGGNPEGDVTIVEFMDYRCGYCRKAQPEIEELVKVDGNIRLIVKEFPILGEASTLSSQFAVAVLQLGGAEAYKAVHDELIALRGEPNEESLSRLAGKLGLDGGAVLARMKSPEVARIIEENHALAQKLEIQGTPTFVIDGTMVRGYVPLDGMRQIVAGQRS